MSEFFLYEIENIAKSGVEIKVTETRLKKCDDDYIRTVRTVCFDFSEHDKVFEDKIAELKKDYKTASELLGKYQRENESLKQRVIELENFSCQAEQETESLVEKLKQRIAGLEKELEEWKEEARAVKKNRDEQLKSFRKAVEPYVDIGHMHETIEELKQRIAELESMEMGKPTKYTTVIVAKEINGQEYVRLEDFMSVVNDLQAEIGT